MKYVVQKKPILLHFLILLCLIYLILIIVAILLNSTSLSSVRTEFMLEVIAKRFLGIIIPVILTMGVYLKSNWARSTFLIICVFFSIANIFYYKAVYYDQEFPNLKVDYFGIAVTICMILVPIILANKSIKEWCREDVVD